MLGMASHKGSKLLVTATVMSTHDMQVIMKAREGTSIEDRVRMNILALATVALSQVTPA